MPINDFLPFAIGAGANVLQQAQYEILTARGTGFTAGTAKSVELNKVWRQSAFVTSAIAQFVADSTGSDVLDNGNSAAFQALYAQAISQMSMSNNYAVATGAVNTYEADYTPNITALVDGLFLRFKANIANTGACTFNPDGLGAKPIVMPGGAALPAGAISAGGEVWVQYDDDIGGGSWVSMLSSTVPLASTTQAGIVRIATVPEVSAGTATDIAVDPAGISQVYARQATTLGGYGITDAYTKAEVYTQAEVNSLIAGKQNDLGYTPVQQGTGVGQLSNTVKLGWSADAQLKATVDSTDLGSMWTDTSGMGRIGGQMLVAGPNQVGAYGFFICGGGVVGTPVNPGELLAGANLHPAAASGHFNAGLTAPGTWMMCGYLLNADGNIADSVSLLVRVA